MPVLELALLSLAPPAPPLSAETRVALLRAKAAMEAHSGNNFTFLQSAAAPRHVYVLGAWASVDDHVRVFVPGAENQAVLRAVEGRVGVEWLGHFDVPLAGVLEVVQKGGCVIERFAVRMESRSDFEEAVGSWKNGIGGWRVDEPDAQYLERPQNDEENVFVWFRPEGKAHEESEVKSLHGGGRKDGMQLLDRTAVTILDLESQD